MEISTRGKTTENPPQIVRYRQLQKNSRMFKMVFFNTQFLCTCPRWLLKIMWQEDFGLRIFSKLIQLWVRFLNFKWEIRSDHFLLYKWDLEMATFDTGTVSLHLNLSLEYVSICINQMHTFNLFWLMFFIFLHHRWYHWHIFRIIF